MLIEHQLYTMCHVLHWQYYGEQKEQNPILTDLIFQFGRYKIDNF